MGRKGGGTRSTRVLGWCPDEFERLNRQDGEKLGIEEGRKVSQEGESMKGNEKKGGGRREDGRKLGGTKDDRK
jgi:hypothetical protein